MKPRRKMLVAPPITSGIWSMGTRSGYNASNVVAFLANSAEHDYTGVCQLAGVPLHTPVQEAADDPRFAEGMANGRMIAGAPDLAHAALAALHELDQIIADLGPCDHSVNICVCTTTGAANGLRAALLKAGYTEV